MTATRMRSKPRTKVYVTKQVDVEVEIDIHDIEEFIDDCSDSDKIELLRYIGNPINDAIPIPEKNIQTELKIPILLRIADKYTLNQLWEMFPDLT